jgi:hypothetical protein
MGAFSIAGLFAPRGLVRRAQPRGKRMTTPRHEPETTLANILAEVRSASALLDQRDEATRSRIQGLEASINNVMKRLGRPSGGNSFGPDVDERKSALGLLEQRYYYRQTKHDGTVVEPSFSSEEIVEARCGAFAVGRALVLISRPGFIAQGS